MNDTPANPTMSNALYNLAAVAQHPCPAVTPTQVLDQPVPADNWLTSVMAVGIVLAAVWIVRRVVYPRKFSLARTPGRSNCIHPAYILVLLAGMVLLAAAARNIIARFVSAETDLNMLAGAVTDIGVFAAGLIIAEVSFDLGLKRGMGLTLRRWWYGAARGIVACLIALPVCWGLHWLTQWAVVSLGHAPDAGHPIVRALEQATPARQALIAVLPIVLAPLAEEVLFRGLLQSMARQYTRRPWLAILIVSPLFAAVHASQWTAIPALLFLSIVLGYNYERTGRLLPCIVAHAGFNAIFVIQTITG